MALNCSKEPNSPDIPYKIGNFLLLMLVQWLSKSFISLIRIFVILGCPYYILWITSPPMSRNCVRQEKKIAISDFLNFNPDLISPEKWSFSVKIMGESAIYPFFFLSSDISWPGIFIFYFFPSDMEEIPLSGSVIRGI